MAEQEKLVEENKSLLTKIDYNKGIVVASTKDFQESCVSILKREQMLTRVVREIEKNLQHFKDYEECSRIVSHPQIMEQPKEMISVMSKIQKGIEFFREHLDFKKADVQLKKFENLRQTVLESKIYIKITKILRDANSECNLRVVQSNILESAKRLEDIDISHLIYAKQISKTLEQFDTCKQLMSTLLPEFQIFCEQRIYQEYFDNRMYLMEQYLDSVTRILQSKIAKSE